MYTVQCTVQTNLDCPKNAWQKQRLKILMNLFNIYLHHIVNVYSVAIGGTGVGGYTVEVHNTRAGHGTPLWHQRVKIRKLNYWRMVAQWPMRESQ